MVGFEEEAAFVHPRCVNFGPTALAMAQPLTLGADVVVSNFRPGTMWRFALDRASPAAEHPSFNPRPISSFSMFCP